MIGEKVQRCLCGGDYLITKVKGINFEAQCRKCKEEGLDNIIKGTYKKVGSHN